MAAITICSDFGDQKNKVCHCFHCFPSISHEVVGNANENHSELSLHKTIEWILESLCIAGCSGSASVEEGMVSS